MRRRKMNYIKKIISNIRFYRKIRIGKTIVMQNFPFRITKIEITKTVWNTSYHINAEYRGMKLKGYVHPETGELFPSYSIEF